MMKAGVSEEDSIETWDSNVFIVEKEMGIQITPDFPVVKLFWYFEQLSKVNNQDGEQ